MKREANGEEKKEAMREVNREAIQKYRINFKWIAIEMNLKKNSKRVEAKAIENKLKQSAKWDANSLKWKVKLNEIELNAKW